MLTSIQSVNEKTIHYPIYDSSLPFSMYIEKTRHIVEDRRMDLQLSDTLSQTIITANTPFEFMPNSPKTGAKYKYGVLLIHGLFDCPFSLRDIGLYLQQQGVLVRSILLPGHGTKPADLLDIHYHDWLQAVKYGVQSLRQEVDHLFLVGYSTGATLSLNEVMQNHAIEGLVLLSPAIRIKPPLDAVLMWKHLRRLFAKAESDWVTVEKELDYAKYSSIPFNAVFQLTELTDLIGNSYQQNNLKQPFLMIVSREDETISSHHALEFFNYVKNDKNKLLLYTSVKQMSHDPKVLIRHTTDYESIKHFSHNAIPFSPHNAHYGKKGDFIYASLADKESCSYGAYNVVEQKCFDWLCRLGLSKNRRMSLTYNPDFEFMSQQISDFIFSI